ncbi:MAG TPA: class I SAM-dependent methyltransferase [Candidatus Polarisedimenticolia bacterium]|nr:class I SAM-dependent methyltransferase [Candidatus Polarisedimenticolia bacterium]
MPGQEAGELRNLPRENVYGHRKRLHFFVSEIGKHQQAIGRRNESIRILDVGCGTGTMVTRPLAELGYPVVGLDTDEASIRQGIRLNATRHHLPNLSYAVGLLEEQRFGAPFDVIVCSEVLEHLRDPGALVDRLRDALADDGLLLITVPNGYGLFELDNLVWKILSRIPGFWRLPALWLRGKGILLKAFGPERETPSAAEEDGPDGLATLNEGQPHCQRFTRGRVVGLFRRSGLRLVGAAKSSVWAGPFATLVLRDVGPLIRLNCRLADLLPSCLASGLYFSFRKSG